MPKLKGKPGGVVRLVVFRDGGTGTGEDGPRTPD
jgi:hypothetical protein